jgi:ribosomal-protein-alanine N-acetyltransferase
LRLEKMREDDLDEVVRIERASFGSPWTRGHFLFEIRQNRWAVNRVARRERVVLSYACVWELAGELKINNLAVRADWRRRGLARWMLGRILSDAAARGCTIARLEVRESNRAATGLYETQGFVETGRRPGYYQREKEDAILMESVL